MTDVSVRQPKVLSQGIFLTTGGMNSPKPNSLIARCLFALTVRNVLVSKDTAGCQEVWQDIPSELFRRNKKAVTGNKGAV